MRSYVYSTLFQEDFCTCVVESLHNLQSTRDINRWFRWPTFRHLATSHVISRDRCELCIKGSPANPALFVLSITLICSPWVPFPISSPCPHNSILSACLQVHLPAIVYPFPGPHLSPFFTPGLLHGVISQGYTLACTHQRYPSRCIIFYNIWYLRDRNIQ